MNSKILDLIKEKSYVIPSYLLCNYKKLNIDIDELVILIYFINSDNLTLNYKTISDKLNIKLKDLMLIISSLKDKKIIEVKVNKNSSGKLDEFISLDLFYNKIFLDNIESNDSDNIYSKFESEFKRTLSPVEYELLTSWKQSYNEDLILEALKEAILSGVTNFKYIDRILFDWNSKGINSADKVVKNNNFKKKEVSKMPDYDWLDE